MAAGCIPIPGQLIQIFGAANESIYYTEFALLLPVWFGPDGALYSMPVSDVLTFVISVIALIFTYRELKNVSSKEQTV